MPIRLKILSFKFGNGIFITSEMPSSTHKMIDGKSTFCCFAFQLELVSKELNHFGVIAGLFRQIGGHSSKDLFETNLKKLFSLFCYKELLI